MNLSRLALIALFGSASASSGFAQLVFSDWVVGQPSTKETFTIQAPNDDLSTSSSYYTSDLKTELGSIYGTHVPAIFSSYTGGGWVLTDADGTAVIAADSTSLDDPHVSYSTSYSNSSSSTSGFSMQFQATFSATSFPATQDRATLGVTLTDGTEEGTGTTATANQSATLINTSTSATVNLTQTALTDTVTATASTQTGSAQTAGYPAYLSDYSVTGTYNELQVTITGTAGAGAEVGLSGRVDANPIAAPEPSSTALLTVLGVGALLFHLRSRKVA